MNPTGQDTKASTLREHLRSATALSHDRLDAAMRPAADWRSRDDYARFLAAQYAARVSVEHWLSTNAPDDLRPPEQTPLLADDLSKLGKTGAPADHDFAFANSHNASVIGVAWVLAGSSLGNRAMLHEMKRKLAEGEDWPCEFLSSSAMTQFWQSMRGHLEAPTDEDTAAEATNAAASVFDHFLAVSKSTAASAAMEGSA